jgi:hypothetical protein
MENRTDLLNEIIRPSIDDNGVTISNDGIKVLNCVLSDNCDIRGITEDNTKALYVFQDNKWLFGSEISKLNLVNLASRTKEERQRLGSIGGLKAKENREAKKNINELAKAMLEQTLTEDQLSSILGSNTSMLLDNTVASAMLGAMIQSALAGSFKAFEAVRDTAGYKPKNEVELSADIMTDADKALIDKALRTG